MLVAPTAINLSVRLQRFLLLAVATLFAIALGACLLVFAIGWWLDFSQTPIPADAFVVLSGDLERPFFAAELYKKGLAPEVWVSHPHPSEAEERVRRAGISYPKEENINTEILVRQGVPRNRIRAFGLDVASTEDEARAFCQTVSTRNKTILVVTSRYHARRTWLIFHKYCPSLAFRVVAPPGSDYRHWWRHKELAQSGVLEFFKTIHSFSGTRVVVYP